MNIHRRPSVGCIVPGILIKEIGWADPTVIWWSWSRRWRMRDNRYLSAWTREERALQSLNYILRNVIPSLRTSYVFVLASAMDGETVINRQAKLYISKFKHNRYRRGWMAKYSCPQCISCFFCIDVRTELSMSFSFMYVLIHPFILIRDINLIICSFLFLRFPFSRALAGYKYDTFPILI